MLWSILGVLALVVVLGGGYYVFSNSGEQNLYIKDKVLCEASGDAYELATQDKNDMYVLSFYLKSLRKQTQDTADWVISDYGNFDESSIRENAYLGFYASRTNRISNIGSGLLSFSDVKVFEFLDYYDGKYDCSGQVVEGVNDGFLRLIDKKAKVYYMKDTRTYAVCSANDKFVWIFKNKIDAVQFGRATQVCEDAEAPRSGQVRAIPIPVQGEAI